MNAEEEEHLIKTRLSVDERPLKKLVKKLVALASPAPEGQGHDRNEEDLELLHHAFLVDLQSYELLLSRMVSSARTAEKEIGRYEEERVRMESEHRTVSQTISRLHATLSSVLLEREHKLAYDLVARSISSHPPRSELATSIDRLHESVEELKAEKEGYESVRRESHAKFSAVLDGLVALRESVGEEVGRRERREVERAEGDGDGDGDGDGEGDGDGDADVKDADAVGEDQRVGGVDLHSDAASAPSSSQTTRLTPSGRSVGPSATITSLNPTAPAFTYRGSSSAPMASSSPRNASRTSSPRRGTGANGPRPAGSQREDGEEGEEEEEEDVEMRDGDVRRNRTERGGGAAGVRHATTLQRGGREQSDEEGEVGEEGEGEGEEGEVRAMDIG